MGGCLLAQVKRAKPQISRILEHSTVNNFENTEELGEHLKEYKYIHFLLTLMLDSMIQQHVNGYSNKKLKRSNITICATDIFGSITVFGIG